jgi:nicotinamidase-related amidase
MSYQGSAINPAKTALTIVDMENNFVAEGSPLHAAMVPAR